MRTKVIALVILISAIITFSAVAQEYKSFQIENIAAEAVWPAVYKAFQELKLPRPVVNKNAGTGQTSYYYFTALLIKNRTRFRLEYTQGTLTISMFGRQYLTDKGWADNMMPMSKKQASNILDPVKERIIELTKDTPFTTQKQIAKTEAKTEKTSAKTANKAGIYEDFVIVRTGNQEIDLLAVYKNGNLVTYDLWDDNRTAKSLVFRENKDSEAVTVLFDEKGFPKGMVTDHIIVNISSIEGNMADLRILDLQGNTIGNNKIQLPDNRETNINFQEDIDAHGPSNSYSIVYMKEDCFPCSLVNSSTITRAIACGAVIAAGSAAAAGSVGLAGPVVVIGVIAACESLYFDVVSKYIGGDHFMFNELILASEISDLVAAAALFNFKGIGLTGEFFTSSSIFNSLITSNINSVSNAKRLLNKYFPVAEIVIEGPSVIKTGIDSEWGNHYGIIELYAKSNYPEYPVIWSSLSERLKISSPFDSESKYFREGFSGIRVKADENCDLKLITEFGQIIETSQIIEAKQVIKGTEIKDQKRIDIQNPHYYYFPWPDCSTLQDLNLITEDELGKCFSDHDSCLKQLKENADIIVVNEPRLVSAILDEHILSASGLVDPDFRIDSEKLNFVRKLWKEDGTTYPPEEAGQLREFVKPAPCMGNWFGFGDKQTIILLAHEAMDKMQVNQDKIKTLQKAAELVLNQKENATEAQFLKIAADINTLEDLSKKIRVEYGDKIKKIAEKGTIQFTVKKTDPAKYYNINGAKVVGAHWSNKWLDILIAVDLVKTPVPKVVDGEHYFETAGDIRFQYVNSAGEAFEKGTVIFLKWAMLFDTFEKVEVIDFNGSLPVLRKKTLDDKLDTFW